MRCTTILRYRLDRTFNAIIAQSRLLNHIAVIVGINSNRGVNLPESATVKVTVICAKVSLAAYSYDFCATDVSQTIE